MWLLPSLRTFLYLFYHPASRCFIISPTSSLFCLYPSKGANVPLDTERRHRRIIESSPLRLFLSFCQTHSSVSHTVSPTSFLSPSGLLTLCFSFILCPLRVQDHAIVYLLGPFSQLSLLFGQTFPIMTMPLVQIKAIFCPVIPGNGRWDG